MKALVAERLERAKKIADVSQIDCKTAAILLNELLENIILCDKNPFEKIHSICSEKAGQMFITHYMVALEKAIEVLQSGTTGE